MPPKKAKALAGKTIVFTGTLDMKRTDATLKAKDAGATVTGAISGKTDIVVAGAAAGSKLDQAKAKGIEIMTEAEFVKACGGAGAKSSIAKPAVGKKTKAAEKSASPDDEDDAPKAKAKKAEKKAPAKAAKAAAPAAAAAAPASSGARPVDREVPGRGDFRVLDDWAITLNQTNIGGNNNKYYIIQVLQKGDTFYAWNRWGRVGESGQNKLEPCGSKEAAILSFKNKFRDKTKNAWESRANFKTHEGKYTLVETEDKEESSGEASQPIGKLSKSQIEKGQVVLGQIQNAISSKQSRQTLVQLSSSFFTLIPTDFGRRVPEPITTTEKAAEKEELLKFYLRMGFEEVEKEDPSLTPISGVMQLPLPKTLAEAIGAACNKHDLTNSVSKGKMLANKKAGGPVRPMDQELYGSILLYTSNAIYRELNKVLRDENRGGVKKFFNYLRMLFEATDRLPQNEVRLWRGISVDLSKQYKIGDTITWWGVSSCTADVNVAKNFMKGCGGDCTLLTIDTKTACDISQVTFYSNEKESLLLPGTQLKVKSNKKNGKIAEIHLEEVGRAIN